MIKLNYKNITDSGEREDTEGFVEVLGVHGGGGGKGGGTAPAPVFVPPAVAPLAQEAATQESAVTPEEEAKRKKEALKTGAKSLQIPTGGGDTTGTGQVGTGTKAIPKV